MGFFTFGAIFLACYYTYYQSKKRHGKLRSTVEAASMSKDAILNLFNSSDNGGLPAWLRMPDSHQSSFINQGLSVLWPSIDRAATAWAFNDRNLENLLNSSSFWKPSWLAASGVVLQSLELGQVPPTVTSVKVHSVGDSTDAKPDTLVADMTFEWSSKMQAVLVMKTLPMSELSAVDKVLAFIYKAITVKVHVKELISRGQIRVIGAPLLNELPVVGTLRLSFLGAPTISYNVSSMGTNPLFIPGLESWLNSFITNQVLHPFTFPEGFIINLGELFGVEVVAPPIRPQGVLSVTIHRANNVPRMDSVGGADPYVKMFLTEKFKARTSVIANTRSPKWEETFEFVVYDVHHQELTLELWDSDSLRPDDLVGIVELPLEASLDLSPGKVNALTLTIPRMKKKGRKTMDDSSIDKIQKTEGGANKDGVPGLRLGEVGRTVVGADTRVLPTSAQGTSSQSATPEMSPRSNGEVSAGGSPSSPAVIDSAEERESEHVSRVQATIEPSRKAARFARRAAIDAVDQVEKLTKKKPCTLEVSIQFVKFNTKESDAAHDAQIGLHPGMSGLSPRMRRVLKGGMLYLHIERADGLASNRGVIKTFKIKAKVGPIGGAPLYKKKSERTGIGRGLNSRSPVFDEDIDFLIDGEAAQAGDTVVTLEIWITHLLLRPDFKGSVTVPLARVISAGRMRDTFPLEGGSGTLDLGLEWQGVMDT